jgi:hypothetical protein
VDAHYTDGDDYDKRCCINPRNKQRTNKFTDTNSLNNSSKCSKIVPFGETNIDVRSTIDVRSNSNDSNDDGLSQRTKRFNARKYGCKAHKSDDFEKSVDRPEKIESTTNVTIRGSSNFNKLDGNEALITEEQFDFNTNGNISNLYQSSKNDLSNHLSQLEKYTINTKGLNRRLDLNYLPVLQTYNTTICDTILPNDKIDTFNLRQDTVKVAPSDIKLITHPQEKIFTAVKSVPSCISKEEDKSVNLVSESFSGNRKRKVACKYNRKNNKNIKSEESAVSQVNTTFVSKTEVNDRLYEKSKNESNVQSFESIHGHSYATKHPHTKNSEHKTNCENRQNTLDDILLFSPNNSSTLNTRVNVKTEKGRLEETILNAKEQTQPIIFTHQSSENTSSSPSLLVEEITRPFLLQSGTANSEFSSKFNTELIFNNQDILKLT